MKAVILAGGLGTRLSEETSTRPKPMVEIGGKPILWHIMKMYSHHGITDFIICCGYKGYLIKEYFANYFLHMSDVTFDMKANSMKVCNDPVKTCSGHTIGENSHGYDDGRRNQEMDGQAQSGIGGGNYSRKDLDLRGFQGI
jgi:glucose-1-phosphate cytidylyltransferase